LARLCNLHVPEKRRRKLADVADVLSERGRLNPFSPRHVRHFAESQLLNFVGQKLPSRLIGRSRPVGDELLQLRNVWPAVPGALPATRDAEVNNGIDDPKRTSRPIARHVRAAEWGVVIWPLKAAAQRRGSLPTIGFLVPTTSAIAEQWTSAFRQRLQEHGWIDGKSIKVLVESANGSADRFAPIAAEFVRLNVDW
jgi:hypothetical protein